MVACVEDLKTVSVLIESLFYSWAWHTTIQAVSNLKKKKLNFLINNMNYLSVCSKWNIYISLYTVCLSKLIGFNSSLTKQLYYWQCMSLPWTLTISCRSVKNVGCASFGRPLWYTRAHFEFGFKRGGQSLDQKYWVWDLWRCFRQLLLLLSL